MKIVKSGSGELDNLVLLYPNCHRQLYLMPVHINTMYLYTLHIWYLLTLITQYVVLFSFCTTLIIMEENKRGAGGWDYHAFIFNLHRRVFMTTFEILNLIKQGKITNPVTSDSQLDFDLFQYLYNQGLIEAVISKPLAKNTYDYHDTKLSPEGGIRLRELESGA